MMKHYLKQKLLVLSVALVSIFGSLGSASAQTQLPYLEDFDQGSSGWISVTLGGANDWAMGAPVKSFLSGAYSAPNGWVTSLNSFYSDDHDAAIVSPVLDFSATLTDPLLRLTHKFITESCCDGGVAEISINGGPWTVLDNSQGTGGNSNTTNSRGWYNGNVWSVGSNCWLDNSSNYSSNVGGWIKSQTVLTGAAGQSNVRIRFKFSSDGSVRDDGWLIDNIEIFNLAGAPYASTGTYSMLTNTNVTLAGIAHDLNNAVPLTTSGILVSTSPNPTIGGVGVIDSPSHIDGAGRYKIYVDGLTPGTLYYYRAYAVGINGTTYGVDSTFTTLLAPIAPYVLGYPAQNVEPTKALLGGSITNNGGAAITASGVVFSTAIDPVLGGPGVIDSTSNPLVTTGDYAVTVEGLTPGTWYYFSFYATSSAGTSYSAVDSFETPPLISSIPYTQNFDLPGNTGWYTEATGGANNWELGTPVKPYITGPASAPNSWVTKLSGDYVDNHNAALVSVTFDFSSLTVDPLIKFSHTFITESCCDGAVLEISINGGPWTTLDNAIGSGGNNNTAMSLGWYNGNVWPVASNCWRGTSTDYDSNVGGWITSRTALTGAAGQSNVRVRFRFGSDGSSVRDGWAIDDIEIYPPSAPTVLTSITTYMNSSNGWLNGMIDDNGGMAVTASGVVFSTSAAPVIGGPGVADSTTNPVVTEGKFGLFVSGLSPATTYFYRAYATNAIGTSYGADSTFTTDASASVPLMQNDFPNNIGYASATLGGNVLSDGGDAILGTGLIYSTSTTPVLGGPGVVDSPNINMNIPYKFDLTGLTPSTWYYYRVYGTNAVGTGYGEIDSFFTDPTIVSTGTSSLITNVQAKLSGNIRNIYSAGDNSTITQSGILVSTTPNPVIGGMGVTDSLTNPLVNNGDIEILFQGLSSGTQYYFRAYAISSMGTFYGVDSTFTTNISATVPSILTGRLGDVSAYAANVGGEILTDGGDVITASGVVYSTTPGPAIGGMGVVDSTTNPLITNGVYTFIIGGLIPSTTYYIRAYATNAQGTSYGLEDVFTTDTVITSIPYSENYDVSGVAGWENESINGGNNDWQLGSPSKSYITGPLSSPNSWVTGLFGEYSDNHDAVVTSPQFDMSSVTLDPIIKFSHKFITESCCDGGVLEMSINGGAWVNVNNVGGSGPNYNTTTNKGWYNGSLGRLGGNCWLDRSDAYSTNSSGWIESQAVLTGAAGQSNVRVRFRFATDPSVTEDGWVIDDVSIVEPVLATIETGTSFNVTQASATLYGKITSDGGAEITTSGIVVGTSANPSVGDPGVMDSVTNPVVKDGPFGLQFSGLSVSTTYHFRSYAINAVGTSYGPDSTFTTFASAVVPYLIQDPAFNISQQRASVSATITSDGGDPITASGVVLSLTPNPTRGGGGVIDSITNPAVTSGVFSVDFGTLLPNTVYYFRAYAVNSIGVGYGVEDSFITDPIVTALPYTQNFDVLSNNGWKGESTGGVNDWETGTPFKGYISAAQSAPNVWITKLSGDYSDGQDGSLVSPQFDLTAYPTDPVLRFSHKFVTESCCDGGFVEMSLDGGATWIKLDDQMGGGSNYNSASSIAWYNNSDPGYNSWGDISLNFASEVNGWIRSETRLIGAGGQANVRFRFRFLSDGSVTADGWAIDDIEVLNIPVPTLQASAVSTANITNNDITVSWTNGDGEGRIVVARFDTSANVVPTDWRLYNANSIYGAGSNLGSFNYVVYNGTGTDVTVTGLPPFRTFTFVVYEYNGHEMLVRYLPTGATTTATTLPVTYLSFTGKKSSSDAVLNWATATEKNNKGFEVERSLDGRTFEYAGFVKGYGNSSAKQDYTFTDKGIFANASNKVVLYRLKQIDFDGKSEYSKTVAISVSQEAGKDVVVYPNPFSSAFTVQVETPVATLAKLELYDMQGRLISTMDKHLQAGTTAVDVSAWNASQSGVYILRVSYADTIKTIRLVKTAE